MSTENINVISIDEIISPVKLKSKFSSTNEINANINRLLAEIIQGFLNKTPNESHCCLDSNDIFNNINRAGINKAIKTPVKRCNNETIAVHCNYTANVMTYSFICYFCSRHCCLIKLINNIKNQT
jgi:hypothetical protein